MSETTSPVCFGAITFHGSDNERCQSCTHFDDCSVQVEKNIKELSHVMDLGNLLEEHRAFRSRKQTQTEPTKAKTLAVNPNLELLTEVKSIANLMLAGRPVANLRNDLRAGKNPFPQALSEQWVLCELLRRGPVSAKVIEGAVLRTGGSARRSKCAVEALKAIQLIRPEAHGFSVTA